MIDPPPATVTVTIAPALLRHIESAVEGETPSETYALVSVPTQQGIDEKIYALVGVN